MFESSLTVLIVDTYALYFGGICSPVYIGG